MTDLSILYMILLAALTFLPKLYENPCDFILILYSYIWTPRCAKQAKVSNMAALAV